MPLFPIAAMLILAAAPVRPCHDQKGRPVACPAAAVATHCHDPRGREAKCGTPGARPAGLKTEKPHG